MFVRNWIEFLCTIPKWKSEKYEFLRRFHSENVGDVAGDILMIAEDLIAGWGLCRSQLCSLLGNELRGRCSA